MRKYGKKLAVLGLAAGLSAAMGSIAYAGEWKQDGNGWWYQNDDGSYPTNCWQWLDGNQDGIAECYSFDENGYMRASCGTPDFYVVNADGAWTVNGVVQTKSVGTALNLDEWKNTFRIKWSDAYNEADRKAGETDPNSLGPIKYSFTIERPAEVTDEMVHELCEECISRSINRWYWRYKFVTSDDNVLTITAVNSVFTVPDSMKE